jgi:hypothetical protein
MVIQVDLSSDIPQAPGRQTIDKPGLYRTFTMKLRVWKSKWATIPLSERIFLIFLLLGVTVLISAGVIYEFIIATTPPPEKLDTSYELLEVQHPSGISFPSLYPLPPEVKDQESPINGLLFTKDEKKILDERKPLMVMIENSVAARPQAGLFNADLVYESLVESGITRFMAVFWSEDAPKVGPIRSLRYYFLTWAAEYDDPPIENIGWAGYEDWEEIQEPEADARAYIRKYNVKSFAWYGRSVNWRDYDKFHAGKAWEHVAYSETKTLWDDAKVLGWNGPSQVTSLHYKKDELKEKRPLAQEVEIKFLNLGGESYKVKWVYDREINIYKRFLAGEPHIDENNNKQIFTKNIIIQHIKYRPVGDKNGRIVLSTIGSGNAQIIRDGLVTQGTWKKDDRTSRTQFFNTDGTPIELDRGKIWIEIVPVSGKTELSTITIK